MVARVRQVSTMHHFSSKVNVAKGDEWSHGAISDAIAKEEGIKPSDLELQFWCRSDGTGETYEPGKTPKSWF